MDEQWARLSRYAWRNAAGYQVSAARTAGGWLFSAWGCDSAPDLSYRPFANGQAPHWAGERYKVSYARGESAPQRNPLLGIYDTAEAARSACEADAKVRAAWRAG